MKSAAYILVFSLVLALSIVALVFLAQNRTFMESNPVTTPTPTSTVQSTPTPSTNATYKYSLTFSYAHHSEYLNNNQTEIQYTIIAANHENTPVTINYSDFYLRLSVQSGINTNAIGTVEPQNNGTLTLDPLHTNETFTLTFQIPTYSFNGVEQAVTRFDLYYDGQAKLFG